MGGRWPGEMNGARWPQEVDGGCGGGDLGEWIVGGWMGSLWPVGMNGCHWPGNWVGNLWCNKGKFGIKKKTS